MRYTIRLAAGGLVVAIAMGWAIAQTPPATKPTTAPAHVALTNFTAGDRGLVCHDPSAVVKCKDDYWIFYTGTGIPSARSKDMATWQAGPRTIATPAPWVAQAVPNNQRNNCWAPDVVKVGDQYFMYYAVSTFGSRVSAIGLATSPTLDPTDPAYKWSDGGLVVQTANSDNYNAIDPAVSRDDAGGLWMAFGSFWSGIKMIQLDPKTGRRIKPDSTMYSLAHNSQIEASYVYHHDKYYYLFVNWGKCCNGVMSTYNIRVGRSEKITGPYIDKAGVDMLNNGGSLLLDSEDGFIGPGQTGILVDGGHEWFSFHYEADLRRRNALGIRPLAWDKTNWPVVGRMTEAATTTTAPSH